LINLKKKYGTTFTEDHKKFLLELFKITKRSHLRRRWIYFDFIRHHNYFNWYPLKREFLKDPFFRDAYFHEKKINNIHWLLEKINKDPKNIEDPMIVDFFDQQLMTYGKLNIPKGEKINEFSQEILERELNFYNGNYLYFEEVSIRSKIPDNLKSYLFYSKAAEHDYYKPVPLGLGGISDNRFQRSQQKNLLLKFIQKYPFHPAINDSLYRLARIQELDGNYLKAIDSYLKLEHYFDPTDSFLFIGYSFIRINYLLHNVIPIHEVLYLEKSSKDLRIRFLSCLASANRFYISGKFDKSKRHYLDSKKLLKIIYKKKYNFFLKSDYFRLLKRINISLNDIKNIYPLYKTVLENKSQFHYYYLLGKLFYKRKRFLRLPNYYIANIYEFFGYSSPGYVENDLFFFQASGNYMAWVYFYEAAKSKKILVKMKSIYSSANCALRLSYPKFQKNLASKYNSSFWKKLALKNYQYILKKYPNSKLARHIKTFIHELK